MIARLDRTDLRTDRLDDAGGFVAEHQRARIGIGAFDHMQIGMADADSHGADQYFARARLADADFLDAQRRADLVEYSSFHGFTFQQDWLGVSKDGLSA
ncbi:hypothetical protein D3C80_1443990 [compost metagenome]